MDEKLLAIYLNDHYAGAAAGYELAGRAASSNAQSALGDFLHELQRDIAEERKVIEAIMERLGVGRDRLKPLAAWTGEKLGRLKLNGQISGYSPLSRLVELEGLMLGVTGKLGFWRALLRTRGAELSDLGLEDLAKQAERQREKLEKLRMEAAALAFGEPAAGAGAAATQGGEGGSRG